MKRYDGQLVGAGGNCFDPGTRLPVIRGVLPARRQPSCRLLFVNGTLTRLADMRAVADATGREVIGVHTFDSGAGAVETLARAVLAELMEGRRVHVMAHGAGAVIAERALDRAHLTLSMALGQKSAERTLQAVTVETFCGAGASFPDGPFYVHYVNRRDSVAVFAGKGALFRFFDVDDVDTMLQHRLG